jgi:hypothetical protein
VILAAFTGHTAKSREQALVLRRTIDALGWKDAAFAEKIGLTPHQLSRQLAGAPLNLFRLADLPDVFHAEWDRQRAALRGAVVLEPDMLSLIRGAVARGEKSMASFTVPMVLPLGRKESAR